jgi:prophage regulatory protein
MNGETSVMHSFPARIAQRKLLRLKAVLEATGLTRSTLYRKIANGTFPRPVPIGDRAVAWRESAVVRWMDEQEAKWDEESVNHNAVD